MKSKVKQPQVVDASAVFENLPEKLVLRLDITLDRDYAEEAFMDDSDGFGVMSLQRFLDQLRDRAYEILNDDLYNLVQTAPVLDQDNNVVCD